MRPLPPSPAPDATPHATAVATQTPARPLRVLVADDSDSARALLKALLEHMGHTVHEARDGVEAVEVCRGAAPDVVLMDVTMPRLDGFGALARIRQIPFERWIPVIFLTAIEGTEAVARALMEGGDDYLQKPVQINVLKAKLHAIGRALSWQDEVFAQRSELADYRDRAEAEKQFARSLLDMLANTSRINDPSLAILSVPAEQLNGDVVAAARTPNGKLHVLLADGTGHGLAAALNVLPTVEPFYSMTAKGFGLPTILAELNRKLYTYLPSECYVAASMVCVDAAERRIEIWNGGMPDVLLIERGGAAVRAIESRGLPLGILKPGDFDAELEAVTLERDAVLVLSSDGLIEALGDKSLEAGLGRLTELVTASGPGIDIGELVYRISASQKYAIDDDLTLVAVDCRAALPAPSRHYNGSSAAPLASPSGEWSLSLSLNALQLRETDVVPLVLGLVRSMGLGEDDNSRLFVILSELFNNALDHGLLLLSTECKDREHDIECYFKLREHRLGQLENGSIDLRIARACDDDGNFIEVTVADSGPGFDVGILATHDEASRGGRGLRLVRELCSNLQFRGTGNVVVARLAVA